MDSMGTSTFPIRHGERWFRGQSDFLRDLFLKLSRAGGIRTHTRLSSEDFKSSASANSATAPASYCNHDTECVKRCALSAAEGCHRMIWRFESYSISLDPTEDDECHVCIFFIIWSPEALLLCASRACALQIDPNTFIAAEDSSAEFLESNISAYVVSRALRRVQDDIKSQTPLMSF